MIPVQVTSSVLAIVALISALAVVEYQYWCRSVLDLISLFLTIPPIFFILLDLDSEEDCAVCITLN